MHLNKVLVLGCSRSGTTEFCKTLQEVSSKKFIWEFGFDDNLNRLVSSLGITEFLDRIYKDENTLGIKYGVYPQKKIHLDLIDSHDIVFFLSRRNVFEQAISLNLAKRTDKWRPIDFGVETFSQKEKDEYNKLKIEKIEVEDIKKDIQGIKEASIKVIDYLKNHKSSRILFYEDLFGFFSGVKLNTQTNYENIENWQELKTFYEENKDFCYFDL